jgi:hypothetical protein
LRCGALQLKQPASLFRKMLRNVIWTHWLSK